MPGGLEKRLPVVALVQVEAGLVALGHIQRQLPAVLLQHHGGGATTTQPARHAGQALQVAHAGIGALVQAGQAGQLQQRIGNHLLPAFGTAAQKLGHQRVAVLVHHQTGQAIGLAMHQAHAIALNIKQPSCAQ